MVLSRVKKRSKANEQASANPAWDEGIELVDLRAQFETLEATMLELRKPIVSVMIYDMQVPGERIRLASDIWTRDLDADLVHLRRSNSVLNEVLLAQINADVKNEELMMRAQRHVDGMLLDTTRAQNMHKVPLLTAATSILGEFNKIPREYHDATAAFHMGAAMSEKWVTDFIPVAMAQRPGPAWEVLDGIAITCFDNLSMQIDYKSYCAQGEAGRKCDMTNWFYTPIPQHLAPGFDAAAACMPRHMHTNAHILIHADTCTKGYHRLALSRCTLTSLSRPDLFLSAAL